MAPGHGRADYLLFVDQRPVGVIEAKPVGHAAVRGGVAVRDVRHRAVRRAAAAGGDGGRPVAVRVRGVRVRRRTSPTGSTREPRARRVFNVPQAGDAGPDHPRRRRPTRRPRPGGARSAGCPRWTTAGLRPAQIDGDRRDRTVPGRAAVLDRSLVQMATGAGKTYTAVTAGLPAAQVRRVQPDAVPGRPQQPGRPDAARSSGTTRTPGRRAAVHRAVQRGQAHRRGDGRRRPRW